MGKQTIQVVLSPLLTGFSIIAQYILLLDFLNTDEDESVVTMEQFSKLLDWFGPMETGVDILDKVNLLNCYYFVGGFSLF